MIKPKNNFLISGFFNIYIRWIIKHHFYRISYNVPGFSKQKAVLLIANHFSWWDGFVLLYINQKLFKKNFHIMVLGDTIKKFDFFRYLGAFSVDKGSRAVLESVDYAAHLLNNPDNMVVIFPQGKLYSNFVDDIAFGKGASAIASRVKGNFQYIFAAAFMESLKQKKPSMHVFLKNYNSENVSAAQLQQLYQQHYNEAKLQQTSIVI